MSLKMCFDRVFLGETTVEFVFRSPTGIFAADKASIRSCSASAALIYSISSIVKLLELDS
jgi:hypothetical protein